MTEPRKAQKLAVELRDLPSIHPDRMDDVRYEAADELERLDALINSPSVDDFLHSVRLEAAHQRERWGDAHDRGKTAGDWLFLVGYLAAKANVAHLAGNTEKALHHTISSAAALYHWHTAVRLEFEEFESATAPTLSDIEQYLSGEFGKWVVDTGRVTFSDIERILDGFSRNGVQGVIDVIGPPDVTIPGETER